MAPRYHTDIAFRVAQNLRDNFEGLSESASLSQLKEVLEMHPEIVHRETVIGHSLLHDAAECRSPEYCKLFLDIDLNLVKSVSSRGRLPFHHACSKGNVETAKYLYHLYPDSINIQDEGHMGMPRFYPLQSLIYGMMMARSRFIRESRRNRNVSRSDARNEERYVELARFLVQYDQGAVSSRSWDVGGGVTLHFVCSLRIEALVKLLFDAYPEAIHVRDRDGRTPLDRANRNVRSYFEHQINLEQQAREDTTPDNNGQLPIHRAVQDGETSVGAIKLMAAANPASMGVTDNQGQTLLHLACQRGNLDFFEYIVGIDQDSLKVQDLSGNLPLHHACMRGNCDIIPLIIEQSTYGVTLQNSNEQIPIQLLLFESDCDRDSMEYVEAVRCLFQVNPVDILKCLTGKDKSDTDNDGVEQGADRKRKRV
eukprot:scaffold90390_cov50-Cyclotella_meneghiniana.AAC.3